MNVMKRKQVEEVVVGGVLPRFDEGVRLGCQRRLRDENAFLR